MIRRTVLPIVLLIALLAATAADAASWRIDPVHSRLAFAADHSGFSQAIGTFAAPRGWLQFDPDDWRNASVEVEIDLSTLDLGDADWNARIHRRDFLDSERHRVARFVSERVEPLGDDRAQVHGILHLKGARHPVTLDVRLNKLARHPLSLRRSVGFSATAQLSRAALGMRAWKRLIGDSVTLQIELEAQRARRPDRRPPNETGVADETAQ